MKMMKKRGPKVQSLSTKAQYFEFAKRFREIIGYENDDERKKFLDTSKINPSLASEWAAGNKIPTKEHHWIKLHKILGEKLYYLITGEKLITREAHLHVLISKEEKRRVEEVEGPTFWDKLALIPIAKDPLHAGNPEDVREDPDGYAVIYDKLVKTRSNFIAFRVKGKSMEPSIQEEGIVVIDTSQTDVKQLNKKMVAVKNEEDYVSIKRLKIYPKNIFIFESDNPLYVKESLVYILEQVNSKIVGKVTWWCGKQE